MFLRVKCAAANVNALGLPRSFFTSVFVTLDCVCCNLFHEPISLRLNPLSIHWLVIKNNNRDLLFVWIVGRYQSCTFRCSHTAQSALLWLPSLISFQSSVITSHYWTGLYDWVTEHEDIFYFFFCSTLNVFVMFTLHGGASISMGLDIWFYRKVDTLSVFKGFYLAYKLTY